MAKIYAQMYSVREDNEKDFKASLKRIADIGYDGVEFAGYYGIPAEELKAYMDELGMETLSAHVGFDLLKEDLEGEIKTLKILGAKYIVCPHTKADDVASAKEIGKTLKAMAVTCKEAGMPLLYHNHAHEFQKDGDKYPVDILFEEAPEMLQQPDIFWVQHAGIDPIAYLEENKDRIKIIHMKQLENMETKKNVNAQSGMIDFQQAMATVPNAYYIYEQEFSDVEVIDDMGRSLDFIRKGQ